MIYRGRISRPRRADIDSRRFSNICQAVPYRSRGRRTFFRFSATPGRALSEIVSIDVVSVCIYRSKIFINVSSATL